jgi:hypothetical protein
MAAKLSSEMLVAKTLAEPFTPSGQGNTSLPLSCRSQPDGGMVVIAADGRKLWFSAEEVIRVREELEGESLHKERVEAASVKRVPVRLVPPPKEPIKPNNGKMIRAAIVENLIKTL